MIRKLVFTTTLLASLPALAQDLPTAPYLPVEMAAKAADAALKACASQGHNVTAAVAGRDGAIKVLLKADNAGPHTVSSASGKAFTAASLGRGTADLAEFIATRPAAAGLRDMDSRMVVLAGGLPVRFGKALVAGIGVGGAPSGDIDAGCAAAGLAAIGAAQ
jgi:uncharacterized protein GlcG (DUF336 family)